VNFVYVQLRRSGAVAHTINVMQHATTAALRGTFAGVHWIGAGICVVVAGVLLVQTSDRRIVVVRNLFMFSCGGPVQWYIQSM
jgi:hypothetical protein